ncbi:MAG: chemotaxis protein CheX [Epulopiscium sp.]|jgi:chemotaxis protein CheX|nr:chemotaxis protein CheX [Candidatus Epulonipiscium sp.]
MDVKFINPFIQAVLDIMPQLGFQQVVRTGLQLKANKIIASGVVLTVGFVGEKKGNVVYVIDMEGAKQIASTMMMGMPVPEFDEMAESAVSELSNMLSANASIHFSEIGIQTDISVPALMYGENIEVTMNQSDIICAEFNVDGIQLQVNVSLE